jgi:RimJ/RimL family protein N-acetyltransferase
MEGKNVSLRDLSLQDVSLIRTWFNDPEINHFLIEGFPKTKVEIERFVEVQNGGFDPLNRALAITLGEDPTCIGTLGCYNIDWHSRNAELGVVIGRKEHLGKGYGTEAVKLLLSFAFNELGLHRIFLRAFGFNKRAIHCFRKCGFVEEGRLRETYFREGTYHNILVMSILEEEYLARERIQEFKNSRNQE